jgi:rhodanese-related sulfurtransferase
VRSITKPRLRELQADSSRSVYLLDVRSPEEFARGHLPRSLSAPGGQLIQATDTWLAVRHAAVVLIDDNGARATTTAAWLVQMGWKDVYVLEHALEGETLESGASRLQVPGLEAIDVDVITAEALHDVLGGEVQVVDLAGSARYSEAHIPGAWHLVRSRMRENLTAIPQTARLVFTAPSEALAKLAAHDAKQLTSTRIEVLSGGTPAWAAAGYPLESGTARLTGPTDDVQYKALERKPAEVEAAIRQYLSWEVDLLNAIESDPDFGFRRFA